MTSPRRTSATTRISAPRSQVQWAALIVGVVFLVVGIAGFVPGVTTHYNELSFLGHHSGALLLGLFAVSILHNIVHLLFGVAGIAFARSVVASRLYLIVGGVIYAVLWLYGLIIDRDSTMNFVPLNTADNWLHLILALGMLALGLVLGRPVAGAGRR
ncbi:DUF4383 domain-containing protein [Mycolicibacterium sp. 018/SC-01/001]|uniref:DUF4383 domain-containing protein n=1 Tax=Mycolicibacterium sp. 018/SC-01/001 TaxID=2592069 RepID=UPI00117F50D9|nr:DUF4383 domain-containing protein [Mycolicibacterium sp. 018/SC-01/001]TRW88463.1 DUF4383 domain-containing protein [Mycolicibacterium sp. 018/SC-01/001]